MMLGAFVDNWMGSLSTYLTTFELPVWESLLLMILAAITIFRKELSSNRDYRPEQTRRLDAISMQTLIEKATNPPTLSSMMDAAAIRRPFSSMEKMRQDMVETLKGKLNEYSNYPFDAMAPRRPSEDHSGGASLELANDIILHVCRFMDVNDLMVLTAVDFKLGFICSSESLWRRRWMDDYSELWKSKPIQRILDDRGITWTPKTAPKHGWRRFSLEFEYAWRDWLLAGANREDCCLIAIGDCIYDVTDFVPIHPGSQETMLDHAGADVTSLFNDIGHSTQAKELAQGFVQLQYPNPLRQKLPKGLENKMNQEFNAVLEIGKSVSLTASIRRACKSDRRDVCTEQHRGCLRAFYDPTICEWHVWWSCCGVQQQVDRSLIDGRRKVTMSSLMPAISVASVWS